MERLLPIRIRLLGAPILAGRFAGRARHGWVGVAALIAVLGPAFILTLNHGWPLDPCDADGGCREGLILFPVYTSAALAILALGIVTRVRSCAHAADGAACGPASSDFNQGTH